MRTRLSFLFLVLAFGLEAPAQTPAQSCPSVAVEYKIKNPYWITGGPGVCPGATIVFTAAVSGVGPKDEPGFHWTVAGGEIIDGQGTASITVQPNADEEQAVTATVRVSGVSSSKSECDGAATATAGRAMCCLPPCPTISIQCPAATDVPQMGTPMTVSVNLSGGDPNAEVRYKWEVSAGTITAGQGTPTIKIDTTGLAGNNVTATVELGGFPPECDRTESCTVIFENNLPPSRKFDAYGDISSADEDERLARFAEALRREPGAQGYIFYYGRGVYGRLGRALEFLKSQPGIDPSRITAVKVRHSEKFEVELWIRPTGAPEPKPEPRH